MVYRSFLRPLLFRLPPETAHELALHSLSIVGNSTFTGWVAPRYRSQSFGELKRFGLNFPNPIGLAAGFDKDGIALPALSSLGFGFIEAGTLTFHAQPGNPRPRLFRLPKDKALINRAGFNNKGAAAFVQRLKQRPDCILGVSIGKSKIALLEDAVDDYLASFEIVFPVADYVAINVSSPNTPQLRELQQTEQLSTLVKALQHKKSELEKVSNRTTPLPLLVKLAPDIQDDELGPIVETLLALKVDGVIATNTTISRSNLRTSVAEVDSCGSGGLSGLPLQNKSTRMIAELFKLTRGTLPIIGVGGIFNAEDAWEKICAGASLLQVYTGFIYEGPSIAKNINDGLLRIMEHAHIDHLDKAVGSRAEELTSKMKGDQ
jgi:dihydroorotate dehydrogenase